VSTDIIEASCAALLQVINRIALRNSAAEAHPLERAPRRRRATRAGAAHRGDGAS